MATAAAGSFTRRTLLASVTVPGIGIHSGEPVKATLVPAGEPGGGVVFRVGPGAQEIPARASNVTDTRRCTVLGSGGAGAGVATVEHLLSALAGVGVTDCFVDVDGPELPIGDGSARLWVEAVGKAGVRDLAGAWTGAEPIAPREPILVPGAGGAFITCFPSDSLRLTVVIAFEHPLVGTQAARWDPAGGDDYASEIAGARTFGFIEEVEALRAAGLARGGSLDNAVVVYPDRFSTPPRFANEMARHKLLDLLGDLSLAGRPVVADIVAHRPSHRLNTEFARLLEGGVGA